MVYSFLYKWIPWIYNIILDKTNTTYYQLSTVYTEVTTVKEWYFFKDTYIPIQSSVFTVHPSLRDTLRWRATVSPPIFYKEPNSTANISVKRHVSWLGYVIKIPSIGTIDLSDWVSEVEWSGDVEPTPLDLFMLWCCYSGNPYFLLLNNTLEVELIDMRGELIIKRLNDSTPSIQ
jgi:hypothetical protein